MFGSSKALKDVEKRILALERTVLLLQTSVEAQEMLNTDMRNKVLRKIQQPKKTEQTDLSTLRTGQTVKFEGEQKDG